MHVGANDGVGRRRRAGDAAFDLAVDDALGERRERFGRIVAGLHFHAAPIDRRAVEPRWRAGLQASELEAGTLERR